MIHEAEAVVVLDHDTVTLKDIIHISKSKKFISFLEKIVEVEIQKQKEGNCVN